MAASGNGAHRSGMLNGLLCLTRRWDPPTLRTVKRGGRPSSLAALVTAAAVVVVLPLPASAGKPARSTCPLPPTDLCTDYVFGNRRWASMPIAYHINPVGAPPGAEQDIQDAFLTWQSEIGSAQVETAYPGDQSNVSFLFLGPTTASRTRDGINTVFFEPCDHCGGGSVTRYTRGQQIVEFDMFINAAKPWSTDLTCPAHNCGTVDLQNVVTHEVGHVLDLYHVAEEAHAELTMYPRAVPDEIKKRDLGAGEVLGVRAAYPL
jgi:hypothetical protein